MKKTCTKCGEEKELELFVKNKRCKNGRAGMCKMCRTKYSADYYQKNKHWLKPIRKKYQEINGKKNRIKNKIKIQERSKIYYQKNKEKIKQKSHNYYKNNKKIIRKRHQLYQNKRCKEDSLFKLRRNISTLVRNMLVKGGYNKNTKTFKILGCSFEEFKRHLESQFQKGMTWDNYGRNGWHIDHIYPVSKAKNERHLIELNHYTNLQPLWEKDNLSKGNKIL